MLFTYRDIWHDFDCYKIGELHFKIIYDRLILLLPWTLTVSLKVRPDSIAFFRGEGESPLGIRKSFIEFVYVVISVCQIQISLSERQVVMICQRVLGAFQGGFQVLNTTVHVSHHVGVLCQVIIDLMQGSKLFAYP